MRKRQAAGRLPASRTGSFLGHRRSRALFLALAALFVVVGNVSAATAAAPPLRGDLPPVPVEGLFTGSPPEVTAESWILYDATFERVLAEEQADERRAMASTTKMMTALLAAERSRPFELVTISEVATETGEAEINLVPGEVLTMNDLLHAMLLESANDAASAVAEHLGGTVEGFVKLMNDRAVELGLENTSFANPHGLDEANHYSTARDLLVLAQAMMANEQLAAIARTRVASFPPDEEGEERTARTTNQLLYDYAGANGVKTGFTDDAGWTLVASAERSGRTLYVVVMASASVQERFADAAALLDYGFSQFGVIEVIVAGVDYARRRVPAETEAAVATDTFSIFANRDDADQIELTPAFTETGAVVIAHIEDTELARVPLEGAAPPALPDLRDAVAWASRYWDWVFGNE